MGGLERNVHAFQSELSCYLVYFFNVHTQLHLRKTLSDTSRVCIRVFSYRNNNFYYAFTVLFCPIQIFNQFNMTRGANPSHVTGNISGSVCSTSIGKSILPELN